MLLNRQQLSAALFASSNETRFALNHIQVNPDGTVWASNGHVAVKVTRANVDDVDFPVVTGIPDEAKSPTTPVHISAETALAVAKSIPKRSTHPVLTNALLQVTDSTIYLATTDLDRPVVSTIRRVEVDFPKIEQVLLAAANKKPKAEPFGIDVTHLTLIAKLRERFPSAKLRSVKVTAYGAQDPISFEWADDECAAHAIVMPVRL